MYQDYLVKDSNDVLQKISKTYAPANSWAMLPGEDARWIEIGDITDPETLEVTQGPVVNETTKAAVQAQDALDAAQKAKDDQVADKYVTLTDEVSIKAQSDLFANTLDSTSTRALLQ